MTITTDPTTTTIEAPAWLDLDGFCSPAIREQLRVAAEQLEAVLEDVEAAAKAAWLASTAYEDATDGDLVDGLEVSRLLGELTGFTRLHRAAHVLQDLGAIASLDKPDDYKPDWYTS